jgi:hypothetical protein
VQGILWSPLHKLLNTRCGCCNTLRQLVDCLQFSFLQFNIILIDSTNATNYWNGCQPGFVFATTVHLQMEENEYLSKVVPFAKQYATCQRLYIGVYVNFMAILHQTDTFIMKEMLLMRQCANTGRGNIVRWRLIFMEPQYGTSFMVKGPAADATDAPQPWGLLCNTVMKMISVFSYFRVMEHRWNEINRGKPENRSTRGKTCPSATLSTTNPTWTDPGWTRASAVRGSMELASCHPSGDWNFEVVPRVLENLWTHVLIQ